jgi:hypothetical protein
VPNTCSTAQKRSPELPIAAPKSAIAASVIGLSAKYSSRPEQDLDVDRDDEREPDPVVERPHGRRAALPVIARTSASSAGRRQPSEARSARTARSHTCRQL